jgi:hypothetical protein
MRYTLNVQIKAWFRHEIWGYRRCAVENASVQRSDTVSGGEFPDVSKDCTAFIFKVNSPRLMTFLRPFLTETKPVVPIFKGWRHIEYPKTSLKNGHYLLRDTTDQRSSQVIFASCSLSICIQHSLHSSHTSQFRHTLGTAPNSGSLTSWLGRASCDGHRD